LSVTGNERTDGVAGDTYVRPASRRHGRQVLPGWRDPDWSAQNWRDAARLGRRYLAVLILILILAAWHLGDGLLGYWHGYEDGLSARHETKESNND
jgi:hypothetical protein